MPRRNSRRRWRPTALTWGWRSRSSTTCSTSRAARTSLGKPVLSDIREGRITLPLIYSINSDGRHNGLRLRALLEDKSLREETQREILDIVKGNGALDYTFRRAQEYSLRAREIMSGFPASAHREALGLLADFVLLREH